MQSDNRQVAFVGAGMGGLAAAAALRQRGIAVQVCEQEERFLRIGAGIQMSSNAMKVHRMLGLEERLRKSAFQRRVRRYREFDTGACESEYDMAIVERKFGAPHLMMHRGDLHAALLSLMPQELVHRGKKLTHFEQDGNGVTLFFTDGTRASDAAMIGADGVHSVVRDNLFGPEQPHFNGRIAYRSTYPAARLNGLQLGDYATQGRGPTGTS